MRRSGGPGSHAHAQPGAVARLKDQGRPKLRRTRAESAGGVVVRRNSAGAEIVIGRRRREKDGVTWTLPKGTPHAGETREETAVREVTEETGLEVRIVGPIGSIDYHFTTSGARIFKTVHYFLMEPTGGDLSAHDHEFEEVRWIEIGEAVHVLSFPTERTVVERVLPLIRLPSPAPR